jgi:hypothetical protein
MRDCYVAVRARALPTPSSGGRFEGGAEPASEDFTLPVRVERQGEDT